MRSVIQDEILNGLRSLMNPVARFLLRSGIGYREFASICKLAFVDVATSDYGIRGRPTNVSRVAVMTGLTRKEVKAIRKRIEQGSEESLWLEKLNLPTQILHYWHHDPDFCEEPGKPKAIPVSGTYPSFNDLVRKYAGDIPPGAMRVELARADAIAETSDSKLIAKKINYIPENIDAHFVRSMFFSLGNLSRTLVHNANVNSMDEGSGSRKLERYVWTARISPTDAEEFEELATKGATKLLTQLDKWVGEREQLRLEPEVENQSKQEIPESGYGLGVYYIKSAR
jgi:hypothetical protein